MVILSHWLGSLLTRCKLFHIKYEYFKNKIQLTRIYENKKIFIIFNNNTDLQYLSKLSKISF